jgi:hypothetical protein
MFKSHQINIETTSNSWGKINPTTRTLASPPNKISWPKLKEEVVRPSKKEGKEVKGPPLKSPVKAATGPRTFSNRVGIPTSCILKE